MQVFKNLNLKQLADHPLNAQIYGDSEPDVDMVESVRKIGIIEPLVITATGTIIAGHRRRRAALLAGMLEGRVIQYTKALDPLEIERLMIESNRQREKTVEQRAREFKALKAIETSLAAGRKGVGAGRPKTREIPEENGKKNQSQKVDSDFPRDKNASKSVRKAAEKVGLSAPTAIKAAEVVDKIDEATAAGDAEKAKALREKLNNEPVAEAHRAAVQADDPKGGTASPQVVKDEVGGDVPERLVPAFAARADFRQAMAAHRKLVELSGALANGHTGGVRIRWQEVKADLDNIRRALKFAMPYAVCPYCHAVGPCEACHGLGWVGEATYDQAPKDGK